MLFIDLASRYLHLTPHFSTGAKEAIQEKHLFELFASQHHRQITCYHTDNGIFASKEFRSCCKQQNQKIKYCSINAHHQNGIAKCYIHTITERARTMLIHATISWPDIISDTLWPYALRLAIDLHSSTPTISGLTPEEIFTGIKGRNCLPDFHSFGCPIFVLEPSLQQGHKIPRWKPLSRLGVYLGLSPDHASSIPLVLSTTTGLVSPQFHVVFDDNFSTTSCLKDNNPPSNWSTLLTTSCEKYIDENFDASPFYDDHWFHTTTDFPSSIDSSSSQREPHSTTPSIAFTSPPSQRESLPPPTIAPSGWNPDHPYSTRFRQRYIALPAETSTESNTPINDSLYSAFILVQDSYPISLSNREELSGTLCLCCIFQPGRTILRCHAP
jgi:hypothetical protein